MAVMGLLKYGGQDLLITKASTDSGSLD